MPPSLRPQRGRCRCKLPPTDAASNLLSTAAAGQPAVGRPRKRKRCGVILAPGTTMPVHHTGTSLRADATRPQSPSVLWKQDDRCPPSALPPPG